MSNNSETLQFLAATYLECVSNDLRNEISKRYLQKSFNEFKEEIKQESYDKVLESLRTITQSDMITMFQVSGGSPIKENTNYNQIVVLAESDTSRCIPILRSELLSFYHNGKNKLSLKDSIRVIEVASNCNDTSVISYNRPPCTIAFIEFGYEDSSLGNSCRIYFALFYKTDESGNYVSLTEILPNIRNFLLYRFNLIEKINKDFEGNIYGIQKEEFWKNQWLSIEKAGAHADSNFINTIIANSVFESKCINALFFENEIKDTEANSKDVKNVLQLISNILIARYFRLIFSSDPKLWRCFERISQKNELLSDIIGFDEDYTEIEFLNKKIPLCCSKKDLTNSLLYYVESIPENGGLPCKVKTTYSKRYLIAFFVDIFNNILKRGEKVEIEIEYPKSDGPAYLVLKNSISNSITEIYKDDWSKMDVLKRTEYCKELNYGLKQSIEFENAYDQSRKKGISLGCLNHFMSYFGTMNVFYEYKDENIWYCIKMPIIKNNIKKENTDEIIDN